MVVRSAVAEDTDEDEGAFMAASDRLQDSPKNTHFSKEELRAVVEEAARRKCGVMAHAHGSEGIVLAAETGVKSIEHASFICDKGIKACLENKTWIVPTFTIGEYYHAKEVDPNSTFETRMHRLHEETKELNRRCISEAYKAGVRIALGSDFVGWKASITGREFRYLVEFAQMTPLDAIIAGTSGAAELLEIHHDVGTIAIGKFADLCVINGNPLENIALLEQGVVGVYKRGKRVV